MTMFFTLSGVAVSLIADHLSTGMLKLQARPSLDVSERFVQTLDGEFIDLPSIELDLDSNGALGADGTGVQLLSPLAEGITPSGWGWVISVSSIDNKRTFWEVTIAPEPDTTVVIGHLISAEIVESMDDTQQFLMQLASEHKGETGVGVAEGGTTGQFMIKLSDEIMIWGGIIWMNN